MPLKRRIVLEDAEINSPPEPVSESNEIHLRPGIGAPNSSQTSYLFDCSTASTASWKGLAQSHINIYSAPSIQSNPQIDETKLAEAIKKHDPAGMQFADFNDFLEGKK